jgi:hypothetical protein
MTSFAHLAMDVLTVLFLVGLAGSALVIILSFAEDITELFGHE